MKALAISTFVLSTLTAASLSGNARAVSCSSSGDCFSVSQSGSGRALFSIAGAGTGVDAESWSGLGLYAVSVTSTGAYLYSAGSDGVEAVAVTSGRSAVYAHNDVGNGGFGVYGVAHGTGHAIHGLNSSSSGWAGYFEGNVFTTGTYQRSDARLKKNVGNLPMEEGRRPGRSSARADCAGGAEDGTRGRHDRR